MFRDSASILDRPNRDAKAQAQSLDHLRQCALNRLRALRAYAQVPHRVALALILLLAAFTNFYQLQREGFANLYYAAAIRSMLASWHNFFFVSFDPGGFVTVDKPPLGFWIQTASAKLLGYSGFSILLPQALAGIISVGVLYVLVRRIFGTTAGLLCALFLAITPISVVTNRNNTIDSLLVLTVLVAAYAASRAAEEGSLRWLLLCAVLVGLGFNIKMLEAYLVVPALATVYLLGARLGWWTRIWHLAVAGAAMVALSLSWVLAVDLTPASARPFVDSSGRSNSELILALGYNGIGRLLGMMFSFSTSAGASSSGSSTAAGGFAGLSAGENGAAGVFRLLNAQLGGQTSWLLALGLIGVLASGWGLRPGGFLRTLPDRVRAWRTSAASRRGAHLTPQQSALALWGLWTLTMVVFFSVASFYHRYYLSMLAPSIATLAGIGVVLLWRDYRSPESGWRGWLLPVALVVTALTQAVILADYSGWNAWMTPIILGGSLVVAGVLVWFRYAAHQSGTPAYASSYAGSYRSIASITGVTTRAADTSDTSDTHVDAGSLDTSIDPEMDAEMDAAVVSESVGPDRERAPENGSRTSSPRSWWSLEWLSWLSRMRLSQWLNARLIAATLGVALLLVGPMTWVGISLANAGGNGQLPSAGPSTSAGFASMPGGHFPAGVPGGHIPAGVPGGGEFPSGSPGGGEFSPGDIPGFATALTGGTARVNHPLLAYLEAHRGSAKYLFATANTVAAAPYIIATGQSVMALGGFTGSDQILTVSQLKTLIREGQVNYFVFSDSIAASGSGGSGGPAGSEGAGSGFGNTELVQWVEAHGTKLTVGGTTMYYVSSAAVG